MVTAAVACGKPFTSTGGTGGSSSSGKGGSSSSSGPACTVGDLTSCGMPGQYCANTDPPSCLSCADVARFTFGGSLPIAFQPPDMTANPSYPRVGAGGALYFTYLRMTGTPDLDVGHADPDPMKAMKWMQGAAEIPAVNTLHGEAGGLLLPNGDALKGLVAMLTVANPILLFHRVDTTAVPTKTRIYASDGTTVEELMLPGTATTVNYNIAVATTPPRLWYVSTVNNTMADEFVTFVPGSAPQGVVVTLDNGCKGIVPFTPWVDPTGSLMLISSPYLDATTMPSCKPIAGAASHLFYIDLKAAANTLDLTAKAIFPPGDNKFDRTTPSLSLDLCTLYYTEVTGMDTNVYTAIRQ